MPRPSTLVRTLALLGVLGALLAACGGTAPAPSGGAAATSAPAAQTTSAPAAQPTTAPAEQATAAPAAQATTAPEANVSPKETLIFARSARSSWVHPLRSRRSRMRRPRAIAGSFSGRGFGTEEWFVRMPIPAIR